MAVGKGEGRWKFTGLHDLLFRGTHQLDLRREGPNLTDVIPPHWPYELCLTTDHPDIALNP